MTAALPFAGFGALGGAAFNRLNKTRKPKKVSLLDDRQENILELLNQAAQGQGPFAGLTQTDPEQTAGFFNEAVAQPLINQFNEEILPGITGQFRGKGLGQSTFAGQAAARAGEGLERTLASQLANQQFAQLNQGNQNLMSILNTILDKQTSGFQQPQLSPLDQMLGQLLNLGTQAAGKAFFA